MRRTSVTVWSGIGVGLLAAAVPALGSRCNAGKILFRQQCSICHTAEPGDNGGAQGPLSSAYTAVPRRAPRAFHTPEHWVPPI